MGVDERIKTEAEAPVSGAGDIPPLLLRAKTDGDRGDYDAAILCLRRAADLGAGADAVLEVAESVVRKGSQVGWNAVRTLLHGLLAGKPHNIRALTLLGEVNWYTAQIPDSISAFEKAISIDPNSAMAHYFLARVFGQEGNLERAEHHFTEASRLNSGLAGYARPELIELAAARQNRTQRVRRARYPSTRSMAGEFGEFFDREFGHSFKAVPRFIDQESRFFTMGSCFAREISESLKSQGFWSQCLQVVETVNTTFANRRLVEWISGELEGEVADRIAELVLGLGTREAVIECFRRSGVFIFTMGVAPAFFDRQTGAFVMPRPSALSAHALAEKYEFRTTTVEENVRNLEAIIDFVRKMNPTAKIFLTLSPVPLHTTFEYDSAMIADCVSKSVLRVAADQIMRMHPEGVHYWPSFEIVRWMGAHVGPAYGVDDGSEFHVAEAVVRRITSQFIETFRRPALS